MAGSEREKHLQERDEAQVERDSNRQWHRIQEHTFEVPADGPKGGDAKPITGGTAAGYVFLDTGGEKRLTQDAVYTLIKELEAAKQAIS